MKRITITTAFILFSFINLFAQDWWTKTKKEAIPEDLTSMMLLVEKFKTLDPSDAPEQAFMDSDRKNHPLIKKTNDDLKEFNAELKSAFKTYNHKYKLTSKTRVDKEDYFSTDTARYALKHVPYLRKYQEGGVPSHYYTYLFYFHDRKTKKDYPFIYLFDKKWEKSIKELIGYLNQL